MNCIPLGENLFFREVNLNMKVETLSISVILLDIQKKENKLFKHERYFVN